MAIYYENGSILVVYGTFTSEVTAVSLHTRLTYLTNDSFAVFLLNRAALTFRGQKKLCLNPLVFVFFRFHQVCYQVLQLFKTLLTIHGFRVEKALRKSTESRQATLIAVLFSSRSK